MLDFPIDNMLEECGDRTFRQKVLIVLLCVLICLILHVSKNVCPDWRKGIWPRRLTFIPLIYRFLLGFANSKHGTLVRLHLSSDDMISFTNCQIPLILVYPPKVEIKGHSLIYFIFTSLQKDSE